ncbi:hypothetical protein E4T38_00835 [Aureobasidium subglaciale]|nr:hypothetical protein E4T38_00835 [Aureobasidium subglaciale]KAI5230655.1 hypothetical protein E4T40_00836 [Aureobasidium subglaciale]KAI5233936.1 hypothetical protein E4T41_00834 [Aureobasidium subglaciale]KAI5267320.1 hypothetical protein E4T46_00834 [Aureobasidium subglaciale]
MATTNPFAHYAGMQNSFLNNQLQQLPRELYDDIMDRADDFKPVKTAPIPLDPSKDASIAPSDGSSPFLNLPCELRRAIFSHLLPEKGKIIEPSQASTGVEAEAQVPTRTISAAAPMVVFGTNPVAALQQGPPPPVPWTAVPAWTQQPAFAAFAPLPSATWFVTPTIAHPTTSPAKISRVEQKPHLSLHDALVLNKQIASEILVMLYDERTFAINVHEGIFDGGVEFLNSGLQRLQYREHFTQVRFKRFESPNDPFGFSRIKRLLIRVYPAKEGVSEHQASRHDAMHTHFMLRALVKLLKKDDRFGLNCLRIRFVEPQHTSWRPHPWQNAANSFPRCTSIHGVPNIEVILRALIELRQVQTAICELPVGLYRDKGLKDFVDRIQGVVTGKLSPVAMDDELTSKIEGARDMLDDWIHAVLFATKTSKDMSSSLEDSDFHNVQNVNYVDYYPDEDDYFELPERRLAEEVDTRESNPVLNDLYEEHITSNEDLKDNGKGKQEYDDDYDGDDDETQGGSSFSRAATQFLNRHSRRSSLLSSSGSSGGASLLGMVSLEDDDLARAVIHRGISNGTRRTRQVGLNSTERAKLQPVRPSERKERLDTERVDRMLRRRARLEVITISSDYEDDRPPPSSRPIPRSAPLPSISYGFLPDAQTSTPINSTASFQADETTPRTYMFRDDHHERNILNESTGTAQQMAQTPAVRPPVSFASLLAELDRSTDRDSNVIQLTEDDEGSETLDMEI